MAAQVMRATSDQTMVGNALVQQFSTQAAATSRAVVARAVSCDVLRRVTFKEALPASLVQANMRANTRGARWANAVTSLDSGAAQLVLNSPDGRSVRLGVARAGEFSAPLELWPLVPLVVRGALAAGAWLLADAYLDAKQTEAEAAKVDAENRAEIGRAIARVAQTDPAAAKQLAAETKGLLDAQPTGVLERLAKAFEKITETPEKLALGAGTVVAGLVFTWWLLSRRRKGDA